jgi:hypothetical protein
MKKILATVLLLGAVLRPAPAAAIQVLPGFLLGLNLGKVSGLTSIDWSFRPGLLIGGYLNFALNKVVSIEPELYFTQKGAQHTDDIGMGIVTTSINLSYIEIPLLLKIAIPLGEDYVTRPRIFGGPTVGYLTRGVLKTRYEDYTGSDDQTGTFADLKRWEMGALVGVGMEFDVKGGLFSIDARYSWSLSTISTDPPDKKNKVFALVLGFAFR